MAYYPFRFFRRVSASTVRLVDGNAVNMWDFVRHSGTQSRIYHPSSATYYIELNSGGAFTASMGSSSFVLIDGGAATMTPTINFDAILAPTGTGRVKFGTYNATPATDSTGYIEIKDSGGTTRKVMIQA